MYCKFSLSPVILFFITVVDAQKNYIISQNEPKSAKIIGGELATNAEAPYQVYIKVAGKYTCGGTLISPQHILTAAHCLVDVAENPYLPLTVVAGTDDRSKPGVEKRASEIFIHPKFGGLTPTNDIGIIKLSEPYEISDKIKPAKLPKKQVKAGDEVTVTGYGRYSPFRLSASPKLKKLTSEVLNCDNFIGKYLGLVGDEDLCVKNPPDEGICNGDSGGPLVNSEGEVVGVASRVFGCAERTPDIYTGVQGYLKFINDAMNDKYEGDESPNPKYTPSTYDILDLLLRRRIAERYFFFYR